MDREYQSFTNEELDAGTETWRTEESGTTNVWTIENERNLGQRTKKRRRTMVGKTGNDSRRHVNSQLLTKDTEHRCRT